jgi:hypothetical protein
MRDLYLSSDAILISMGLSFVFCLAYIYIMSAFAETIAWCVIVLIELVIIGAAVGSFYFISTHPGDKNNKAAMAGGIISGILGLLFGCAVWCGRKSLATAIDVIDAAADFLAGTKRLIVVPVIYFFVTLIVMSLWLFAIVCVQAIGTVYAKPNTSLPQDRGV